MGLIGFSVEWEFYEELPTSMHPESMSSVPIILGLETFSPRRKAPNAMVMMKLRPTKGYAYESSTLESTHTHSTTLRP